MLAEDLVRPSCLVIHVDIFMYIADVVYLQVNEGPCNIPKPGFFDFQGKQKW